MNRKGRSIMADTQEKSDNVQQPAQNDKNPGLIDRLKKPPQCSQCSMFRMIVIGVLGGIII